MGVLVSKKLTSTERFDIAYRLNVAWSSIGRTIFAFRNGNTSLDSVKATAEEFLKTVEEEKCSF